MNVICTKLSCIGLNNSNKILTNILQFKQKCDITKYCVSGGYAINQNQLRKCSTIKSNTNDLYSESELIYEGKFGSRIKRVKLFSLTTSLMGLAAQPVLFQKGVEMSGYGLGTALCGIAGIFTFVTPILLHLVTKKYVIELRYDPKTDEYIATTVSIFLMRNDVSNLNHFHASTKIDFVFGFFFFYILFIFRHDSK